MVHHTARYNIKRLIYVESCETAPDAIAREKQLKNWRREKKLVLINRSNPEWRDLLLADQRRAGDVPTAAQGQGPVTGLSLGL